MIELDSNPTIARLREAMLRRKCTQSEMARIIEMDRANFSRLYNEAPRGPSLTAEHITRICRHLKISADWLLGLSEHEFSTERHEWFRAYKKLPRGLQTAVIQSATIAIAEYIEDQQHKWQKATTPSRRKKKTAPDPIEEMTVASE